MTDFETHPPGTGLRLADALGRAGKAVAERE